ncbi:synaptogenesis protein syg-2-like [Mytilus trossulus]|uniref:synaptogenesis protein syg-2-like n=1 Tax=Mytilus trossulus TaxID=6551 RepID=UPI003004C85D
MDYTVYYIWITCFISSVFAVQEFTVTPQDKRVVQGTSVTFECKVKNQVGRIQWIYNGEPLGFDPSIPAFTRYSVITNTDGDINEFNLHIVNTQLSDDGSFECQVLPSDGNPPLRAYATLTILVPPDIVEIDGYSNGTKVDVNESTPLLQLTCHAKNARPGAGIEWYKNGRLVTTNIINTTEPITVDKRENTKSVISIRGDLRNEQQGAVYTCRATHEAITISTLQTMVTLNILYPPAIPIITGYQSKSPVRAKDTVRMICESVGGNPAPQVVWFKNDKKLDYSFSIGHGKSTNELTFTADPLDNDAIYRCESSNQATQLPLTTQVTLVVHFPPKSVTITGQKLGKAGEQIQLKCTSSNTNPPTNLAWLSKGLTVAGANEQVEASDQGGYITTSTLTVTLTNQEPTVLFMCQAANYSTVVSTIELSVLYPPGRPTIEGYNPNDFVAAGSAKSLKCVSSGGNPTATLKWFKGNEELTSEPQVNVGNVVTSDLIYVPKPSDNQAEIKCTASNEATSVPLERKLTITVYFPPMSVNITFSPPEPKSGQVLRLTCTSGPSNPAASIIWVKSGTRMRGTNQGNTPSDHGGYTTTNILEIASPSYDDHGAAFFCEAKNLVLDKGWSDAVTLNVKFKPVFNAYATHHIEIVEGQSATLNMTALGNPIDLTYSLYKDGVEASSSAVDISNGILELSSIAKSDSGSYSLKSENTQGATYHNFTINVTYPASITTITEEVSKGVGGIAYFECEAEANPLVPNMITWSRQGFDMTKTKQTYDSSGKSYLTVTELAKEDSGMFTCTADNRIGSPSTKEAKLIVVFDPKIDKSPQYAKAAGDQGDTIELMCKAEGSPEVHFKWKKDNGEISNGGQFQVYSKFLEGNLYQGELKIVNVVKANYGSYICEVANKNMTVTDMFTINVDGTSIPDAPYDLKFINSTHDSITVAWKPGFNGGLTQTFIVIIRKSNMNTKTTIELKEEDGTIYSIKGLERATEYTIAVKAKNDHGPASSSPVPIQAKTLLSAQEGDNQLAQSDDDDMPVIIILVVCIVGIFLLALNIGLILFFVRKRKKRLESNSDTTSHTNTIELYGPNKEANMYPMTPSDDGRSYGTYEKNMDGFSDDYSNYEQNDGKSTSTNSSHCNCYQIKVGVRSSVRGIKGNCCLPHDSSGDEDVKRVFLPPPAYQSRQYTPSKSESPIMNHKTFLSDSRTYLDEPDRQQWRYEDPYKNNSRGKGSFDDFIDNGYDDDTRPKSTTDFSDRSSRTTSSSRLGGKTPPPQPPVRSSSKGATNHYSQSPVPPLPARNYDLEELPPPFEDERYVRPPGGENYSTNIIPNPSYNGPISRAPSRTYQEDDMRGHLV